METKREDLGKLLATLEGMSNTEIKGKKIDLGIKGKTYREIDQNYKSILMEIHPDRVGQVSEEDGKKSERITQTINSIREAMYNYKIANGIQDKDEFTYLQEVLEEYKQKHGVQNAKPSNINVTVPSTRKPTSSSNHSAISFNAQTDTAITKKPTTGGDSDKNDDGGDKVQIPKADSPLRPTQILDELHFGYRNIKKKIRKR